MIDFIGGSVNRIVRQVEDADFRNDVGIIKVGYYQPYSEAASYYSEHDLIQIANEIKRIGEIIYE